MNSPRMIWCRKYQQELPGLARAPFPGARGQKLFEEVSQQAWQEWMKVQTRLINEKRLAVLEPKTQEYLQQQLENFLDNKEFEDAEGFVAPTQKP